MIRYLTRSQVDFSKYDNCVLDSINSRVYGYSWYLDAVCDTWDVLVLDDYDAVMPLPRRVKYGINYIYQAPWIQQLGLFSDKKIESKLFEDFIQKIPKKFKLIDMMLNSSNHFSINRMEPRDNFVLPLENSSYQVLLKGYSKGRKSSVKQAQKFGLKIKKTISADSIIELFRENKGEDLQKSAQDYLALQRLVNQGQLLGEILIYEVFNSNDKLLGGAIFLKDKYRITNLFSALNNLGREKQAMSFLIDFIIKHHAGQPFVLDFEGSMITKIASFYKSFGAIKETYFQYKKWQLI
ncbi:peptidoglycan bridge formation glycyltransferase FemA/FemB family protein [Aureibaculum sp. A20]|uniref:Peptidoglycan bridge formation glycyltransferase FemA/FemB family protein n=1 Tax=Aureibaculum flavum TaxID=2795986 RepID=A0ABS0WSS4_9FLAO|nr:peptidoglycan bridge formation glycyltransferase FemA/FemB family protein [Aureibaculum flavum]MBJ2175025.1 peptidoglycan bridge formation glycyltransferase FemA/FemB family protein [Aureibaculum flavum]